MISSACRASDKSELGTACIRAITDATESEDVSTESQPFGVVFSMSISYAINGRMSITILHLREIVLLHNQTTGSGRIDGWS